MKRAKIAFWVAMIGFIGLMIFQNQDFFFSEHSLGINLLFATYRTPQVSNIVFFLIFFLAGLLVAYLSNFIERFKARKTIKTQKNTINMHQETITTLKQEVEALKGPTDPTLMPPVGNETEVAPADTENVRPPQSLY